MADSRFYCTAFNYCADSDGLGDHLRDVPWENIFELSTSAIAFKFYEWFQVKIVVIVVNIRASPINLYGFKLFVLLP